MQFFNIVNGEKRTSSVGHHAISPRTEETLWDAPIATVQDLDEAVSAAQTAQKTWANTTIAERQALLQKLSDRLETHRDELINIVMRETGKSVSLFR